MIIFKQKVRNFSAWSHTKRYQMTLKSIKSNGYALFIFFKVSKYAPLCAWIQLIHFWQKRYSKNEI